MKRGGPLIAGALACGLIGAAAADAATFTATRLGDTAPNGCGNAGCTLREAVLAANGRAGPDTVLVRSGKRYELAIPGPDEEAAATGDLDVTGKLTVRPTARGQATIDANDIDRAFDVQSSAQLIGLKLVGATAQAMAGEEKGGAIRAAGGRLLVRRSTVSGASSPPLGLGASNAAIHKVGGGGDLVVERSRVVATDGTGIKNEGAGDVIVLGSQVSGNEYDGITDFAGGAIAVRGSRVLNNDGDGIKDFDAGGISIRSSRVADNDDGLKDFDAGAIRSVRSAITGNEFTGMVDFGGGGISVARSRLLGNDDGGIQDFDAGAIVVTDTSLEGADGGAGIGDFGPGGITVLRSTLDGGGVEDFDGGGVRVAVSRIVRSNSQGVSDFGGGGVQVVDSRVIRSGSQGVQDFDAGSVSIVRSAVVTTGSQGVQNFGTGALSLRRARVADSVFEAVAQFDEGPLRVHRSTVAGSERTGVYVGSSAQASRIVGSTISGNRTTSDGAGIENLGPLTIRNSTIAGNRADGSGGGIMNSGADADLRLNNVTIARNVADADNSLAGSGGGLHNQAAGVFVVGNSVIALNDQLSGDADDCAGLFDSTGGNLRSVNVDCGGFDAAGDIVRSNPRLGGLRRNGGPTATIALKAGSPAIGLARKGSAERRDQRGHKRDADPDSGAFER